MFWLFIYFSSMVQKELTGRRMLAVMTMNVGYFLAVLGGVFVGEMAWGRWTKGVVGH